MQKLLKSAYRQFDFYKDLMDDAKIDPNNFYHFEQLKAMKPVTKEDYRSFVQDEVRKNPKRYEGYCIELTSGSTGMPLKTYRTWGEKSNYLARFLRPFFVNGYSVLDKTLCIVSERGLTVSDSIVQKLGLLRRFPISKSLDSKKILDEYQKVGPDVFYANLSNLVQLALYLKSEDMEIKKPKFYFSVAESLDDNAAVLVKSVFGDNLLNHYGSMELGTMAFQQKGAEYLHFTHDTHYLEILDKNNIPAMDGNLYVTDLDVYSFPLIRYDQGDTLETEMRNGIRVIKNIAGRADDLITLSNGTKRSANVFAGIFALRPQVKQFKIIQKELTLLNIKIVANHDDDKESLKSVLQESIEQEMGQKFDIKFEFLPYIAQDKNGKLAKFVSHLN